MIGMGTIVTKKIKFYQVIYILENLLKKIKKNTIGLKKKI